MQTAGYTRNRPRRTSGFAAARFRGAMGSDSTQPSYAGWLPVDRRRPGRTLRPGSELKRDEACPILLRPERRHNLDGRTRFFRGCSAPGGRHPPGSGLADEMERWSLIANR